MAPKKNHNCVQCEEKDNDSMVQCDVCDEWYHYKCVGVTSAIAEVSWSCFQCCQQSTTTNTGSAAAPPIETHNVETIPTEHHKPQATSSPRIENPRRNLIREKIMKDTISEQPLCLSSAAVPISLAPQGYCSAATLPSVATLSTVGVLPSAATFATSTATYPTTATFATTPTFSGGATSRPQFSASNVATTRYIDSFGNIYNAIPAQYIALPDGSFATQTQQVMYPQLLNGPINQTVFPSIPTSAQLAARHAIPKELPTFSGDPEDWPLFISSFQNSTAAAGYTDAENLIRLQLCLKGRARELVRCKLMIPAMVPEIIQTLKMFFGQPETILEAVIQRARKIPPPKDKLEALVEYAMCVRNIHATMEACQMQAHLNNPMLVKELLDKLPNQQKLSWAMHPKDDRVPIIKSFSDWLFNIAEAVSKVTPLTSKKSASVNTHHQIESRNEQSTRVCLHCQSNEHKLSQCESFKNLPLSQKWDLVRNQKLCRQCLNKHRRRCYINKVCGINSCQLKHHQLLHENSQTSKNSVYSHGNLSENQKPYFRIIPVKLISDVATIDTFAFLDEGSSVTLIERHVFNRLGMKGSAEPLCLQWTDDTVRTETSSLKANIVVANIHENVRFMLNDVHTVKQLSLPTQSLDMKNISNRYPYLAGLPIESYKDAKPTILIGTNNWRVAVPLKVREGAWNQPIASKTRLGWTLQGNGGSVEDVARVNLHDCECDKAYVKLHEEVKTYFSLELPKPTELLSADDERAMSILKQTCCHINGHFEVGLLWKSNHVELPRSYETAKKRLMCLRRKCEKDPDLKRNLQSQVDNLLVKGYARKLTQDELAMHSGKIWYLPIFVISNPNKPGKQRLVWDAAAKTGGKSLNDYILTGPDLLKSLIGVLIAFREGRVAICGDIAEMFHQINIKASDIHAQRFLWWDCNGNESEPTSYVMTALSFGISCAPCIAHYVRDKNATIFQRECPRAVNAIQNHHYMDDFIDSVNSEQEAIELATQVKRIHAAGGFHIRNWVSNSPKVIENLNNTPTHNQTPLFLGSLEKVLGMYWDPNNDTFQFVCRFVRLKRDILNEDLVPSKREVLQVLMSIFDPLGFLSPYTIGLKILLQEVWRSGMDWDDQVQETLYMKWLRWKSVLPAISKVSVKRCYSQMLQDAESVQLHTFVDAGELAYASICYLRVRRGDQVETTVIAAKSKVAPLKPLSVPRLELQAALIGLRLANKIKGFLRIPINAQYWWTDSTTVLQWLKMDPRSLQQFVMYRVGEILENSEISEWRWVPTNVNPADLATKVTPNKRYDMWLSGPDFLRDNADSWPTRLDIGPAVKIEVRNRVLHVDAGPVPALPFNYTYFSKWRNLYRAVATFLLYVNKLKAKAKHNKIFSLLTCQLIKKAQILLVQQAQMADFSDEIHLLRRNKSLRTGSKLIPLNVFIDTDQLLKVRGRAESLNPHNAIVLPNSHHVTFLITRHFHEKYHHMSHEAAINEIRGKYFIPRLRVLFKRVRRTCQTCKIKEAKPKPPQMAPLPRARLASFERPFTFTGIDFFGPLYVNVGRRREKRWGVIFTCLTIRAVHIEVAHSLDTSSCIMCIRNFASRRGTPQEIYTDNGTNFKATEKVLCAESRNVDLAYLNQTYEEIKWHFNPPAAPHMGGAWERLVRSIKTVMDALCPAAKFNDESLRSALWETEFILNSRPLTFVSLDADDDEALTPNHLLIGTSTGYKPLTNLDVDLRQRWRSTQVFADQFWQRWVKEYLPTLTRRSKWFTPQPPITVGDVVIVVDDKLPRNCWPKGVVVDIVNAKDGQVRRVYVKTTSGIMQRPAVKIAVLDVSGNEESALQKNRPGSLTGGRMLPPESPH